MTERHPTANACQRSRRARYRRIDYYPSADALAAINAKRGPYYPMNTNSGVLDAIVSEWATLTGIKCSEVGMPKSSAEGAGVSAPLRPRAYDFGDGLPIWAESWLAASRAREASRRVVCGARRHRSGLPCKAKCELGKRRCKWHGGCSTGPRTSEGKAKALANLKQNRA